MLYGVYAGVRNRLIEFDLFVCRSCFVEYSRQACVYARGREDSIGRYMEVANVGMLDL